MLTHTCWPYRAASICGRNSISYASGVHVTDPELASGTHLWQELAKHPRRLHICEEGEDAVEQGAADQSRQHNHPAVCTNMENGRHSQDRSGQLEDSTE